MLVLGFTYVTSTRLERIALSPDCSEGDGDINSDGEVTLDDATLLTQYLARERAIINYREADVNGDCVVDSLDVAALQVIASR